MNFLSLTLCFVALAIPGNCENPTPATAIKTITDNIDAISAQLTESANAAYGVSIDDLRKNIISLMATLKADLKTQPACADTILNDNNLNSDAIQPKQVANVQKKTDALKEAITKCYAAEFERITRFQKTVDDLTKDSKAAPAVLIARATNLLKLAATEINKVQAEKCVKTRYEAALTDLQHIVPKSIGKGKPVATAPETKAPVPKPPAAVVVQASVAASPPSAPAPPATPSAAITEIEPVDDQQ